MNFKMWLRKATRSTRVRIGALLAGGLLIAGLVLALETSSATNSSFNECIGQFSSSERESGPQPIKEKIAGVEEECRHLAVINESITPAQEQEAKEKFRARHKRGELNPGPEAPPETGIIDSREPPLGRKTAFRVENVWSGEVEGQWCIVYAGAKTSPENEDGPPEVLVYRSPIAPNSSEPNTFVGAYHPPGNERTPLTITAASGDVLTLQTSTGATVSFDVATRTFG